MKKKTFTQITIDAIILKATPIINLSKKVKENTGLVLKTIKSLNDITKSIKIINDMVQSLHEVAIQHDEEIRVLLEKHIEEGGEPVELVRNHNEIGVFPPLYKKDDKEKSN